MKRIALAVLGLGILAGACGDDAAAPSPVPMPLGPGGGGGATSVTTAGEGGGAPMCGSAGPSLDGDALTLLGFDDGMPASTVRHQDWSVGSPFGFALNEVPLHEAVRFELEHPATIYGFEVMWGELPEGMDPAAELRAGLYGDFGYNGFDFWAPDPLWEGTRCAGDVDATGAWTTYAFDTPIEVAHPGLVYVAHRAEPGAPVWWFDQSVANEEDLCAAFDDCQSSFNLPESDTNTYYNGLSFPFQYHFMVRLWVDYEETTEPPLFAEVPNGPTGRHVAWGDFDSDGWDDALVQDRLYRNLGDGTFEDVTVASGIEPASITGGVWGDYDNDGCLDLFAFVETYSAADTLFHSNCDGTFSEATGAGIVDVQSYNPCGDAAEHTVSPSAAAAWVDLDADSYLDLYVANFNCWDDYTHYTDTVFMNDGDGTFTEVTGSQGFSSSPTPSRGVAPVDFDRDGDVDLFVNNYVLERNLAFVNQGDGTMVEDAVSLGIGGELVDGYYGHTIGAAWGDLDNDGDFDLVAANLAHPRFFDFSDKTEILRNDGGSFTNLAGSWDRPESPAGIRYQETHSVPVLFDADADGNLDLAITAVYDGRPTDFYWGRGDGTFVLDAYRAGITTENGWGASAADFDHDGDVDLFATHLFENRAEQGHWVQVKVIGTNLLNREGIGATVEVTTGARTIVRHAQGGSGKGGQDSRYLHFGLGDATEVTQVRVVYPGGTEQVISGPLGVDQRWWITEGSEVAVAGWAPP